ncbi:MAG: hypothetical protein H7230_03160 [Candidatus Parcubacteria bacterium]|nr:hypothetical protein [Candidatus Paceibacterota bacterium]
MINSTNEDFILDEILDYAQELSLEYWKVNNCILIPFCILRYKNSLDYKVLIAQPESFDGDVDSLLIVYLERLEALGQNNPDFIMGIITYQLKITKSSKDILVSRVIKPQSDIHNYLFAIEFDHNNYTEIEFNPDSKKILNL